MELGRRKDVDPLVSYAFVVEMVKLDEAGKAVGQPVPVARFSGVDGLSYEIEMIEYRESDHPNIVKYRQGRKKPARVTLKHGVGVGDNRDNDLMTWIMEAENGTISGRDIYITVGQYGNMRVDESKGAPTTWELSGCMPTKWSLGSLDGNSSANLIESLELVVSSVKRSN